MAAGPFTAATDSRSAPAREPTSASVAARPPTAIAAAPGSASSSRACAAPPPARVLQRQAPRPRRRRDLTLAMAHHRVRGDPGGLPAAAASATITAHSAGCTTRLIRPAHQADPAEHLLGHRSTSTAPAPARTRPAAPRTPGTPRPAPGPSRPTGRPDRGTRTPTRPAAGRAAPVTTPGRGLPGRHRGQAGRQLLQVRAGDHRPVLERRPGGGQRPAHIGRIQLRAGRHALAPAGPPARPARPRSGPTPATPRARASTGTRGSPLGGIRRPRRGPPPG